jgi:hypothetical protein
MSHQCRYCGISYTTPAGVTRHINSSCPVYRLESMKMYTASASQKSPSINNYYMNNSFNTTTNNIIQLNNWKQEEHNKFSKVEDEIKNALRSPETLKYLATASAKDIKNALIQYLMKLHNNGKMDSYIGALIVGETADVIALENDSDKCLEYIKDRATHAARNITQDLKLLTNTDIGNDIFKDVN